MEDSMDKAMVIKAMDRIEALLAAVEAIDQESETAWGDVFHGINNARQIASSIKVLVEMDA